MKYLYSLILIATLVILQWVSVISPESISEVPHESFRLASHLESTTEVSMLSSSIPNSDDVLDAGAAEKLYGLHYDLNENTWTLYATVLQLKKTSIYGRPGKIAQIEYSLDGERIRYAWMVISIDNYSFDDDTNSIIEKGKHLQLYVSGTYVSPAGVDWQKCPQDDIYCMNASFVEGGFPASVDYDGLTLCPSNTIIRSGYAPDDWINGMLAWKIMVIPNS